MELRHLRYFLAVAETENIRRASERLHIAQPAVSRQLQDLERELGIELFDRLPRGLRLNTAGRSYRADVERILGSLAEAGDHAKRVAAGEAGLLKLGYLEIAAWRGAVPLALQAFTTKHPAVRLELISANTPLQLAMIENGDLDGGFIYPVAPPLTDLATRPVRECNVLLAIPSMWSARFGSDTTIAELANLPFIGFRREEHPAYFDGMAAICAAAGVTPRFIQEERSEGAILSLVSAGLGVAIVNDANEDRPPPLVEFRRLPGLSFPLMLEFVSRRDNNNPALGLFLEILKTAIDASDTSEASKS